MHTSAAHPIAQAHRNPHGNLLSAHGTRHHAHPFLTLDVLSAAISMRRRGPAAGMPQPTYVGGPSLCQQKAQTGPGGWKACRNVISMRKRGLAAGKPQSTYVGRPLAVQSVCADRARWLESHNVPTKDAPKGQHFHLHTQTTCVCKYKLFKVY